LFKDIISFEFFIWAKLIDLVIYFSYRIGKFSAFGAANPVDLKTFRLQAYKFQKSF